MILDNRKRIITVRLINTNIVLLRPIYFLKADVNTGGATPTAYRWVQQTASMLHRQHYKMCKDLRLQIAQSVTFPPIRISEIYLSTVDYL